MRLEANTVQRHSALDEVLCQGVQGVGLIVETFNIVVVYIQLYIGCSCMSIFKLIFEVSVSA